MFSVTLINTTIWRNSSSSSEGLLKKLVDLGEETIYAGELHKFDVFQYEKYLLKPLPWNY